MNTAKDESESWLEYWSRVERLHEIQSHQIDNEEKVEQLRKTMSMAEAVEVVYGKDARDLFETRRQAFLQLREEYERKQKAILDGLDEPTQSVLREILKSIESEVWNDIYDIN